MADTWEFGGVALSSPMIKKTDGGGNSSETGPRSLPTLRGKNIPIPFTPGELWTPHQHGARHILVPLSVLDPSNGDTTIIKRVLDQLTVPFARVTLQPLICHRETGETVAAQAQCVDWQPKDVSNIGVLYGATADFELPDPYFYPSTSLGTVVPMVVGPTAIAVSPTGINLTHPGQVRGHRMVLTYTGPITSPRLTNNTNGMWVECDVTVATGQLLVIDIGKFTALNNGGNAIGSIRHSGGGPWMFFEPGVNSLSVTSSAPGGSLSISFQPPYL